MNFLVCQSIQMKEKENFQNEKYKIGELMNNFCPLELTPREWCW